MQVKEKVERDREIGLLERVLIPSRLPRPEQLEGIRRVELAYLDEKLAHIKISYEGEINLALQLALCFCNREPTAITYDWLARTRPNHHAVSWIHR